MSSSSSSSSSSSTSSSSLGGLTRMAGMMSGLDTESLVKAATTNAKISINKRKQKLQTLTWKQEQYRGVASKLAEFQKKYFDILSPTSLKSNAVMKKVKSEASNSSVITSATTTATPATYTISESKKATAATIKGSPAAAGSISLDFSKASSGENTVQITLDGTTKDITFNGGDNVKQNFLDAVNKEFGEISSAKFAFKGGAGSTAKADKLVLETVDGDDVFHSFAANYNDAIGLKNDTSSKIYSGSTLGNIDFANELQGSEFKFSINGVDFSFDKDTTISKMMSTINESDAGVKMSFNSLSQTFELQTKDTGAGQKIDIDQTKGNLLNSVFNIKDSVLASGTKTSKVLETTTVSADKKLTSTKLDAKGIEGSTDLDIKLDGKSYKLDLSALAKNDDNDLSAGDYAKAYKEALEKAVSESDDVQKEALLAAAKEKGIVADDATTVTEEDINKIADDDVSAFNDAVNAKALELAKNKISDMDINITAGTKDGAPSIEIGSTKTKIEMNGEALGFDSKNNCDSVKADKDFVLTSLTQLNLMDENGKLIAVDASDKSKGITINDLISVKDSKGNAVFSYDETTGQISANGSGVVTYYQDDKGNYATATKNFLNDVFGSSTVSGAERTASLSARGTNATVVIDGVKLESAGNSFTVEGTTINVKDLADFSTKNGDEAITVTTAKDTSAIKDIITDFVNDYNTLMEDLYKTINTTRPKSSGSYYDPLTEEQREEMSDKEIEDWEEKAQEGLLYNDNTVSKVITTIRSASSTYLNGFGLASLGIKVDTNSSTGQLKIDEEKLGAAIATYGDEVGEFFTNASNGFAAKMNDAFDAAISTKTNKYGYLTQLAGIENTASDKKNQYYSEMKNLQTIIDNLQKRYDNQQERLWKKYTQLEKYLSNMNMQASMFNPGY